MATKPSSKLINLSETQIRAAWAIVSGLLTAGGITLGPWGVDQVRDQSSMSVTFGGQAKSALNVVDDTGQPIVTTQDYSRSCLKAVDTEARARLKAFAEKPAAN